jgi:uncharacterized protein (DUF849 family)
LTKTVSSSDKGQERSINKVIVTAAITGSIHTPSMSPHLPITPEQIAEEAIKVFEAGGTVAHIHVRDPETGASTADQDAYREIAAKVKKRCNLILCFTTGGRLGGLQWSEGRAFGMCGVYRIVSGPRHPCRFPVS